eukprot:TRINITY_DN18162_c0_g1_i1.p1 TRINITY_DN18162_c0_g1~~TRINITY_DN18162_c0_g1_i1.p1  ORF type:complete len:124 (+),score=26.96 TRINITY_DN18162_c0_g1_i1:155-526(+)
MFNQATINYITHNVDLSEFTLYLIEKGPWPEPVRERLLPIQERIYTVVDAVLDGQIASDYPDSKGKRVHVEVVFQGGEPPADALSMVARLDEHVCNSPEYAPVEIGRAVQQECRDRSRMPSSA